MSIKQKLGDPAEDGAVLAEQYRKPVQLLMKPRELWVYLNSIFATLEEIDKVIDVVAW